MSAKTQLCTWTVVAVVVVPTPGAAQRQTRAGIDLDTVPRAQPFLKPLHSVFESPFVRTVGTSVGASFLGAEFGLLVDHIYCKQHYGKAADSFFGPCTLYAGYGAAIGWFGGSLLGATSKAAHIAKKAGCQRDEAIARALAGAVIGAAPGAIFAAQRTGKYTPPRSTFVFAAPILSGVLAAAAVGGCDS